MSLSLVCNLLFFTSRTYIFLCTQLNSLLDGPALQEPFMFSSEKALRIGSVAAIAATQGASAFPDCVNGPLRDNLVCNTTAHFADRATSLIEEFNLTDLVNNTVNGSPGVDRLGLLPYQWWNEALHGVGSSPGVSWGSGPDANFTSATSFPAPILLGATFNDSLIASIADVISTEARAFNNFNYAGLTFFTPNINPFRDPRWGRGQETPGEDPYHLSRYVYQYVVGLQGGLSPDPYYKVLANCKHILAYDVENWEGNDRTGFNAVITTQDLSEFYTPSFQGCLRDAQGASAMCSYNAVNGVPSCASSYILKDLVRDFWGLGEREGWITGDCGAVQNIYQPHGYTDTLVNATAVAMGAGTDLDCGDVYSPNLWTAVEEGLITIGQIQTALIRLYGSLIRLGYFDPAEQQPYRSFDWSYVNTPSSQDLAYNAAVQGIVLLENDGILPLSTNVKHIALVGPMANATLSLQGNYAGIAPFVISPQQAFETAGYNVTFAFGTGISNSDNSGYAEALEAGQSADVVVFVGGIDNSIEAEGQDRTSIEWPGSQLDLIGQLGELGKPLIVVRMGGGQCDDSALKSNATVNALLWAGYPGQSGGTALIDIISGKQSPSGRLPVTQYPSSYVSEIDMTDMAIRPNSSGSPGRTYKWYTGAPIYPFGYGIHYTTFRLAWSDSSSTAYNIQNIASSANKSGGFVDTEILDTFSLLVTNTGSNYTSDYVALLFANSTSGPSPAPLQELVGYTRVPHITPGGTATAELNVTLGSISRVDENGNWILYPGTYNLWVGVDATGEVLRGKTIELTGSQETILAFPTPPWGDLQATNGSNSNGSVRGKDERLEKTFYLAMLSAVACLVNFASDSWL